MILLVGLAMYFWSSSSPLAPPAKPEPTTMPQSAILTPSNSPVVDEALQQPPRNKSTRPLVDGFASAFAMPISYWGRVVDEKGGPVIGADVTWTANNNPDPNGTGTKGETTTDADGMFFIGSHGIGLYIEVSKNGYYQIPTETRAKAWVVWRFRQPFRDTNNRLSFGNTRQSRTVYTPYKGHGRATHSHNRAADSHPKEWRPVQVDLSTGQTVASDRKRTKDRVLDE